MNKTTLALLVFGMALPLTYGCKDKDDAKAAGSGTVGIVDLDKVFTAMGWSDEIKKAMQAAQADVKTQAEPYVKPARDAFEKKRDDLAKAAGMSAENSEKLKTAKSLSELESLGLTKAQIDEYSKALNAWAAAANTVQQQVNQALQQQEREVFRAYQQAMAPAVSYVATSNGRAVVMTPNGSIIYTDPAADLTQKVIDDLRHATSIKVAVPAMPKVEFPTTAPSTQKS